MSWVDEVIEDTHRNKRRKEQRRKEKAKEKKENPGKRIGWFKRLSGLFSRGKAAAIDAITINDEVTEADTKAEEEVKTQEEITGKNIMYRVPETMKSLKVRILEGNGRLKNQYSLTSYIDIKAGDKVHIIVEE
jgi:translation initiation factor IF-1